MADVAAEAARLGHADERVEVGAVDVDLPAVLVDDVAQLADALLEHAVRRRVGDHGRGEPGAGGVGLGPQVVEVDVALGVARHHDHLEPGHHRAGGVGAVRARGDEADRPRLVAPAAVVGADGQQPGQLALAAGVGLQADRVVAGDGGQPLLQLADQLQVALGLVGRGERVEVRELRPRDRQHLGRGVELHGAGAERDHRAVEREVAVGQPAQVAEQLVLAVVAVEDRVGEELAGAPRRGGEPVHGAPVELVDVELGQAERRGDGLQDRRRRRLVQAQADGVGVDRPQVDPPRPRRGDDLGGPARHPHLRVSNQVSLTTSWPPSRRPRRGWTSGGGPARRCA